MDENELLARAAAAGYTVERDAERDWWCVVDRADSWQPGTPDRAYLLRLLEDRLRQCGFDPSPRSR